MSFESVQSSWRCLAGHAHTVDRVAHDDGHVRFCQTPLASKSPEFRICGRQLFFQHGMTVTS